MLPMSFLDMTILATEFSRSTVTLLANLTFFENFDIFEILENLEILETNMEVVSDLCGFCVTSVIFLRFFGLERRYGEKDTVSHFCSHTHNAC